MDGLGRAVGAPTCIRFDGRLLAIAVDLAVLGEIENFLLQQREFDPVAAAERCRGLLSREEWDLLGEAAYDLAAERNFITVEELQEYLQTFEGVALVIWSNLRRHDPSADYDDILRRVRREVHADRDWMRRATRAITMAGGFDELANLDWSPALLARADEEAGKRINWRLLLHTAFGELGVSPAEFGRLNLYQLRSITRSRKEVEGKIRLSKTEAMAMGIEGLEKLREQHARKGRTRWLRRQGRL